MTQRRGRRDRRPIATVLAGGVALLLASIVYLAVIAPSGRAPSRQEAIGGPFSLVEASGQPVTERSFRGKYLLIYFGYTACEDVCPTTLASLAAALDSLGPGAERVQPLFITVDPERDTPAIVGRYAAAFTPRLIGLTGTPDELRRVAGEYRVIAHAGADAMIDHSSVLYLVGPDGRYLAPIRADSSPDEMARAIAAHLS